jgi:hypothetical protein
MLTAGIFVMFIGYSSHNTFLPGKRPYAVVNGNNLRMRGISNQIEENITNFTGTG